MNAKSLGVRFFKLFRVNVPLVVKILYGRLYLNVLLIEWMER